MKTKTDDLVSVLSDYGISPHDEVGDVGPEVGEIQEGETVYTTSIAEVLDGDDGDLSLPTLDQPRFVDWFRKFEEIFRGASNVVRTEETKLPHEEIEPHCAWYCPIHFYGHGWGIYIRESCLLTTGLHIARLVDWRGYGTSSWAAFGEILRSAFYVFFLHEQFHHKVESLGFRLLVSTAMDKYRPYKRSVYRANFGTSACLEESLANAESYRRLSEPRYSRKVSPQVLDGVREFLRLTMPLQAPGYADGPKYFPERQYRDGLNLLHSQMLDARTTPVTPPQRWRAAPNMITALADISAEIYVVVPHGVKPIFNPSTISPGYTASTREMIKALKKYYGYAEVPGGKGSHIKLKRPGKGTIILAGNRPVLSPGITQQVLKTIGNYPLSSLHDFLEGKFASAS